MNERRNPKTNAIGVFPFAFVVIVDEEPPVVVVLFFSRLLLW